MMDEKQVLSLLLEIKSEQSKHSESLRTVYKQLDAAKATNDSVIALEGMVKRVEDKIDNLSKKIDGVESSTRERYDSLEKRHVSLENRVSELEKKPSAKLERRVETIVMDILKLGIATVLGFFIGEFFKRG